MNNLKKDDARFFILMMVLFMAVILVSTGKLCKAAPAVENTAKKMIERSQETLRMADFGAIGDGIADDSPALAAAIDALSGGKGGILEFEKGKTYRLGVGALKSEQVMLKNAANITIRGNGAKLIIHPATSFFGIYESENINIEGFTVDYDPLPFTQGAVSQIDVAAGSFTVQFDQGYLHYPVPAEKHVSVDHSPWGCVVDRKTHKLKAGFPDHLFFESVEGNPEAGTARITVKEGYSIRGLVEGEALLLPLDYYITANGRQHGGMIISESTSIKLNDLTFYSNRAGMLCRIIDNEGPIHADTIELTWKPGSDRLIASWRDGFHVKDNKVGPVIQNCHLEGLLDDSINISVNTIMARQIKSETEFQLFGANGMEPGDILNAFFPDTKEYATNLKILQNREGWVVIDTPLKGVVCGNKFPYKDVGATQFYNMTRANRGFQVRNCYFGPQRRFAMLIRCHGGLIEKNVINGVCGSGIWLSNEFGSFYEGPIPSDIRIQNNIFLDTGYDSCIEAYAEGTQKDIIRGLQVLDNDFYFRDNQQAVRLRNTEGTVFQGNRFFRIKPEFRDDSVVYRK